ncbi:MAG TPA: fluoride efflux transporter CrcB [Candidatus Acidoferrales bacterium]|nr:fluoride efflux transporter CrcB [Candidatus Acidoferrales bacterium]
MWREALYVGVGGFLGANARYLVNRGILNKFGAGFPYATLFINFSGSVLLGFFLIWTTERVLSDYKLRLFFAIGFCGAYTTFSSYSFETFALYEQGRYWLAASNVLSNNVLALAGAILGAVIARSL